MVKMVDNPKMVDFCWEAVLLTLTLGRTKFLEGLISQSTEFLSIYLFIESSW